MKEKYFHHALKILDEVCTGCTHCIKTCPTQAIRVNNGIACIDDNRCIDCGRCYNVCPVHAIIVDHDDFNRIYDFKVRVALVPSILIGQFARNISVLKILDTLKNEGFTHVYFAEDSIDILNTAINKFQDSKENAPLISSFCPAIVRLIQVKFPSLVENIVPLKAPLDISAISIRNKLCEKGHNSDEIGIFYITPCAAKIAAVKSPEGEDISSIDGVINMDYIYNKIFRNLSKEDITLSDKNKLDNNNQINISSKSLCWALTHGESKYAAGRSLAIDGIFNVIEFLEKIENKEHSHFDYLELRACDRSCAGGILVSTNRFLVTERLEDRARNTEDLIPQNLNSNIKDKDCKVNKIQPRAIKLDESIEIAINKMQKIRNLMCFLPGIDCGACGAPSCKSLAEDIVQRKAVVSDCVFIQKNMLKHGKLSVEHSVEISEKTWGKDRFEKDCTKKGAKYEGFRTK